MSNSSKKVVKRTILPYNLTIKQKTFADLYLETGNGLQSVLKSKYEVKNNNVAGNIACDNLKKPNVIEYLKSKADRAAVRVVELSEQNENLSVAYNSTKDILDRSGYKPVEKIELEKTGNENNYFINNPTFINSVKVFEQNLKELMINKNDESNKENQSENIKNDKTL